MSQTVKTLVRLRELILNGEFTPGERLLETALVEKLAVSRTPIRAALARLTEEGLLENLQSGGYAIREFSERDIQEAIEMRGTLEGFAARLAAERGVSAQDLKAIKDCLAEIDALLKKRDLDNEDIEYYVNLNNVFHQHLVNLAQSFVVDHMLERIITLPFASPNAFVMAQTQLANSWEVFFVAQEQHRCIVNAIENRESARAEALAREHAHLSLNVLRNVVNNKNAIQQIPSIVQYLDS